jgi:hypothetical protein
MSGHRIQMTVFLDPEVHRAAKERAEVMKLSLSATVADAAKESLLSSYRSDREKEILTAAERNFFAVRRLEQRMRTELLVLKELIGTGMLSFFNHIPAVAESGKAAALVSGKQRFLRYLDHVASNLRAGESILGQVPIPGPDETLVDTGQSKTRHDNPAAPAPTPAGTRIPRAKPSGDSKPAATAPPMPGGSAVNVEGQIGLFDSKPPPGNHRGY